MSQSEQQMTATDEFYVQYHLTLLIFFSKCSLKNRPIY